MNHMLYSKYNSLRKPEFRIVTEIREDSREKYVVKRASEPVAEQQIVRIADNRKLLKDYYTDIRVIPVQKKGNSLVFPFISGISLEEKLLQYSSNREDLMQEAKNLLETILSIREEHFCRFEKTGEFRKIFGNTDFSGVPAVCPANVDALFSNFMESKGQVYCIDYEWLFNFSVPLDFIRYRILRYLHYELQNSVFDGFSREEFLEQFGINKEDQVIYEQMEYNFQYYVHGEKLKYHYLHRYLKKQEDPLDVTRQLEKVIQEKDVHIGNQDEIIRIKDTAIGDLKEAIHIKDADISRLNDAIHTKDADISRLNDIIHTKDTNIDSLYEMIQAKDVHIRNQDAMIRIKDNHIEDIERQIQDITNSVSWIITKPFRSKMEKLKKLAKKNENVYLNLRYLKKVITHGSKQAAAFRKAEKIKKKILHDKAEWVSEEETKRQQNTKFRKKVKFSILVPLYNTPEKYLTAMIDSVLQQTYSGWELCLADGSDAKHAYVGDICRKYAKKDKRILYRKLKKNGGISENTNACIEQSTGNYIGLFDHDDLLHPYALFEYMKAICEKDADFIYSDETTFHEKPEDAYWPHHKPDYAPDTLRSYNYICHFTVFKRSLMEKVGTFRKEYDGSQDYDLILRLSEKAEHIIHIPKVLYYWRSHKESTASDISAKPYTMVTGKAAIEDHLKRIGLKGTVKDSVVPTTYKIQYEIDGNPLISIIIPNKDHIDDLSKCLNSIKEKSTWKNHEIIIVENNSTEQATFDYYDLIQKDKTIRVIKWEREFNYSAINNYGSQYAKGEYLLLLNNDVEVITPDWLEQMLMFAQRKDVGAVGAMLYYPDDTVQHAGVILGIGGVAGHSHKTFKRGEYGYASRMTIAQNLSAVTAACILMSRKAWNAVHGLDEKFAVAFNDVDLCMRIRKAGYLIVWTPYAELYHYESKSRGLEDNPEKQKRFKGEIDRFMEKWGKELAAGDPYYNPNLTLVTEDFAIKR